MLCGCAPKSIETRKYLFSLTRRLATAGLQLAAAMTMRIRIIQSFTRGRFAPPSGFVKNLVFISPRTGHRSQVFEMLPTFSFISWGCAFRTGVVHPYFPVNPLRQRGGTRIQPRFSGASGIPWKIFSLVKNTKYRHCAGLNRTAYRRSSRVRKPQNTRRSRLSLNDGPSLCATLYTAGDVGELYQRPSKLL